MDATLVWRLLVQVGDMVQFAKHMLHSRAGTNDIGVIVAVVDKHWPVAENQLCRIFWLTGQQSSRWDDELEIIK